MAVNLHHFIWMRAHDICRFTQQVPCLLGQPIGAGHKRTTAEFQRYLGIAIDTEHATAAGGAQIGFFRRQLIEIYATRLHGFLYFGDVVPDDFIGQLTTTRNLLNDSELVVPDLEGPAIE